MYKRLVCVIYIIVFVDYDGLQCITLTLILLVVCYVGGVFVLSWLFEDNKTYQVDGMYPQYIFLNCTLILVLIKGFAFGSAVLSTVNAIVIQVWKLISSHVILHA
jgi:hypothetical protein